MGKQATITDGDLSVARTSGLRDELDGKISSSGAQSFLGDITIVGSGSGGGLTVVTGDVKIDASKKVTFGVSKLHIGHDGADAVLESDTGDFLIKNYKNGASGDFKVQTRSSGSTYHNDAFKVSYDGNCSTTGSMTVAKLIVSANAPISSADSTGVQHEIRVDDSYIYVKMSDGSWGRAAHSTW